MNEEARSISTPVIGEKIAIPMLENSRSRPKSPPYFSIMSGGQISGPFRRKRQRCTIQSAAHSDSLILLLSVMFDVITSPPQRRSSSSSAVTLTPCCQSKATPKRVLNIVIMLDFHAQLFDRFAQIGMHVEYDKRRIATARHYPPFLTFL
uniref:Uncharacterized protein n=1 Tax=Anopheles melas TaxID=34690 RepID=A0A182UB95_9DIPT